MIEAILAVCGVALTFSAYGWCDKVWRGDLAFMGLLIAYFSGVALAIEADMKSIVEPHNNLLPLSMGMLITTMVLLSIICRHRPTYWGSLLAFILGWFAFGTGILAECAK